MRLITIICVICIIVLAQATAQDKAVLMGDAQDHREKPIPGLKITLRNEALRIDRSTLTDADGLYFFADVTPAEGYIIAVDSPGVKFALSSLPAFNVEVGEQRRVLPPFMEEPANARNGHRSPASQTIARRRNRSPGGSSAFALQNPFLVLAAFGSHNSEGQQESGTSAAAPANPPQGSARRPAVQATGAKATTGGTRIAASVQSSMVPLDYISTAQSSVITANQLRGLPLFNRNFLALGLLAPSTHDVPAGSELQDATFSISGARPTTNLFLMDGMDNTASGNHQAIPFQVNDAVQEFRVVSATSDAQFGRSFGGIVNIVTQRGSAQFHGSLFGYFASDSLNASYPLSVYGGSGFDQAAAFAGPLNAQAAKPQGSSPVPVYEPLNYNQYVATVDALNTLNGSKFCTAPGAAYGSADCLQRFDPSSILAANNSHTQPFSSQQFGGRAGGSFAKKWFWFGDYEGTRIDNPTPIFERVPSSYDRTQWSNLYKVGQSGYDDARLAQNILDLYPQANIQAIPGVLEFYRGYAPNYTHVSNYLGRLDFDQSSTTSWTARYNLQQLGQLHDDTLPASPTYPGNGAVRGAVNQNAVLTLTHQFSNNVTNVLRGGFTRFAVTETPQDANFNASQLGLPSGQMHTYLLSGLDTQYTGATPGNLGAMGGWVNSVWLPLYNQLVSGQPSNPMVTPSLDGLFPFARIGAPLSSPGKRQDSEIELIDNLSVNNGKHLFRTGFRLSWTNNIFNNSGFSRGFVVSSNIGEFTTDSETGNFGLPLMSSSPSSPSFDYAMQQNSPFNTKLHSYTIGGYFQDTWRLRSNLTLNLGLRYEFFSAPSEYEHRLWNYDPVANGLVQQGSAHVVNTFGDQCGTGQILPGISVPVYPNYSYYPFDNAITAWNCNPTGRGSFLVSSAANIEPRIGIAWSTLNGATVLRAGFGIFYDQVPASNIAALGFNRPASFNQQSPQTIYGQNTAYYEAAQYGLGNSSLGGISADNFAYQAASVPFGINAIDPNHFSNPLTRQVSASIEHQITRNLSGEVSYIGNYMQNLPVSSDTNFNNEWFCTKSTPYCDFFTAVPIFTTSNQGYGNYNAFLVRLKANAWHGLQVQGSYTYSKALDNASAAAQPLIPAPLVTQALIMQDIGMGNPIRYALGQNPYTTASLVALVGYPVTNPFGIGSLSANLAALNGLLTQGVNTTGTGTIHVTPYTVPQDPYNFLTNDYGRSDYDLTNRFVVEYTWAVPSLNKSMWLNGWMLSGVFTAQSGQPFTIFSGTVGGELNQRVNLSGPVTTTGNPNAYIGNTNSISLASSACTNTPAAYSPYVVVGGEGLYTGTTGTPCLGNSARNQFTGPAYVNYDMAVQKTFRIKEATSLVFRAESYNLFNRSNYYNPISTYSLDGTSIYSRFGQIESAHNARQFQFAVRFDW
jgi:hypothetical protein